MGKKILVVDDEPMVVELIEATLKEKGHAVFTASDGKMGLKEAKDKKPDLIVLDVKMPKMDGFEVLKRLKKDRHTMGIFVVMLTGEKEQKDIERGIQYQADKYLMKPLEVGTIVAEVEKSLAIRFGVQ